jgi:hypothetical protein
MSAQWRYPVATRCDQATRDEVNAIGASGGQIRLRRPQTCDLAVNEVERQSMAGKRNKGGRGGERASFSPPS